MDRYDVFLDGVVVGSAEVTTEGLYYRFRCRCTLPEQRLYRLTVATPERQIDLGIFVPQGNIHTVDKLMAKKYFNNKDMVFRVSFKGNSENVECISLDPNEPFAYISQLLHARLRIFKGAYEIVMRQF